MQVHAVAGCTVQVRGYTYGWRTPGAGGSGKVPSPWSAVLGHSMLHHGLRGYLVSVATPGTLTTTVDFGDDPLAALVGDSISRVEDLIRSELANGDEVLRGAIEHLFLAGGKRFRPLFTVLAAQLGPHPDSEDVTIAAAVIELVHLATLYHDDVMDEAKVRRGADSANARWGNNVAILAGDYLFATASRLVSRLGPAAVRVIADTFAQLVTGQMRETRGVPAGADPVQHYLTVVTEKTACLIEAAGTFGATFSGCDTTQIARLGHLGEIVGTAFQVSDDIIDIASDAEESGKLPGTDLREGIHTLPVLYALRETGPDADRLRQLLAEPVTCDAEVAEALELLRASAGIDRATETLRRYADSANALIAQLPAGPARNAFSTLVHYTVIRHG